MTRGLKHSLAAVAIAVALSTFGPAASSFFAFSYREAPGYGGMSVIYKRTAVPDWWAGNSANQTVSEQSAMADATRLTSRAAPI
jgi:hypothetical protein